ncbi:hypothetical protein HQ346_00805 [Rhodococcus sp. BP-252]|uniref:Fenitrothion hydrolase n=1 Tax=Rhodococcoides kyotonense TaxID=398843 RepID=A0A177Y743_9NOCA|nr:MULTISPECIES: hypothetical protein [Rhodococcus]NIL75514.1 hypothetical protein [Rhodococcus sp. B10]MBY6410124.1 hypothetical protein [Rhodococcus sp. BP-320]MBY6415093.1 hypothetical protein [Rhodococcus sp. BP-321]MBY6421416.1 hypothetical protein [Rhodococcus sp. BP-324]MBY6425599.1 hypothetical protein [Rhodococcus sp. BP-323]
MILAHGLGGSTDLPLPVTFVLIGGAWALSISFAVLIFAWRTPRLNPSRRWATIPAGVTRVADATTTRAAIRLVALAFTVFVVWIAITGPDDASNALPGVFYVLLWVGVPVVSALLGPVWRMVSPVRTVHTLACRAIGRSPDRMLVPYPKRWGAWPSAAGLFAFVWLELASADPGSLGAIRTWCLAYVFVMIVGGVVFGRVWFENADPFEKYSDTISRLAILARSPADRALILRNPLNGLPSLPVLPGSVAVVAVLLGSTAFDSASQLPAWRNLVDDMSSTSTEAMLWRTGGLLALVSFVGVSFWLCSRATGGVTSAQRATLPGLLVHSLVPIVFGYVLAHYLTYLVEKGQATVLLLADPFHRGWNFVGQQGWEVSYVLSEHPGVVSTVKVLCVLAGHIVGVSGAHDASLRILPKDHRLTGQLALMVLMVFFTFGGLFLLFGG